MAAGDYTITVVVGDWSVTLDKGDLVDPDSDAIAVDPLNATWSLSAAYPSQPTATTCSFGLYVPDVTTGPQPVQGTRVEVTITTPDHALPDVAPVLDFVGLVSDVDATRLSDGLLFSIVAADYTSTLAEERIGDEPWDAEQRYARLQRVVELSNRGLVIPAAEASWMVVSGIGPAMPARDIDSQPTRDVLADVLSGAVVAGSSRPIVSQSVDGAGVVSLPIVFLHGSLPDLDASLPYQLSVAGGTLHLVRKAITPDSSLLSWIPASAVDVNSVTWRQDKATNTNRVRAVGDFVYIGSGQHVGSLTVEFADLVETVGPNEISLNLQVDAPIVDPVDVLSLISVLLGTHYDASPRWTFDSFTVIPEAIADGDQWPRLFNPRQHTHVYDQAVGRFMFITDLAPKWNLHNRADYFGRLAGATLALAKGKIRLTPTLAHRLPTGTHTEDWQGEVFDGAVPANHPITYAELAAGANPTYTQCGDLTPADLQLAEA